MNGYLLSVIATILLSAILTAIMPNGKTSGIIKGITKLACLLIVISPIIQYIAGNPLGEKNSSENLTQSVIQTDESFISYYSEMRINLVKAQLEGEIEDTFGVKTSVTLSYELHDVDVKITEITVEINDDNSYGATVDISEICEYLTKNYGVEVSVE